MRVVLEPFDGTANVTRKLRVTVPKKAKRDGAITVGGGDACAYYRCGYPSFRREVDSFADFLRAEARQPHNNDLVAQLAFGKKVAARDAVTLAHVVTRKKTIAVALKR
jgi:hypothetical protein